MVPSCTLPRWAIRIYFRAENPAAVHVHETTRLFRMADGQTLKTAVKLDEIAAPPGEEPRWFVSYDEVETVQVLVTKAALRALTFWLVQQGSPRRNALLEVTIVTEHDARRLLHELQTE